MPKRNATDTHALRAIPMQTLRVMDRCAALPRSDGASRRDASMDR